MKVNYVFFYAIFLTVVLSSCGDDSDPAPAVDCNISGPKIELIGTTEVSGCNTKDGSIEVQVSGGTGTISIALNGNNIEGEFYSGLSAGVYNISVTDENGCSETLEVNLANASSSLTVTDVVTTFSGCEANDGTIEIAATGEGDLTYSLDDTIVQENPIFSNLASGDYILKVTDASGCDFTSNVKIVTGVSYADQIQNVLTTNCNISGCHNGATGNSSNWTNFSNVQNNAVSIQSRTASGNMPPSSSGLSLTSTEVALIACWVEDGALDN